jgi:hypothetical protein
LIGWVGALRGNLDMGVSFAVGRLDYDDPARMDCPMPESPAYRGIVSEAHAKGCDYAGAAAASVSFR